MTKVEAEFYTREISRHGRSAHAERIVPRHSNGWGIAVSRAGSEPERLMHIEQAIAFVKDLKSRETVSR